MLRLVVGVEAEQLPPGVAVDLWELAVVQGEEDERRSAS